MWTPIDGLPSTPISTMSSPRPARYGDQSATGRQALAVPPVGGVSSCSRTAQNRFSPVNASSGHGICSIRQPFARSTSTAGE